MVISDKLEISRVDQTERSEIDSADTLPCCRTSSNRGLSKQADIG